MNVRLFIIPLLIAILFSGAEAFSKEPDYSAIKTGQVITDQAGRVVKVNKPFTRIISLYGAHTENLLQLGIGDKLIGITRSDRAFAGLENKEVYSYHDGPEKFLAARPDLVLIRPMIDRGYTKLMDRLTRSGIQVFSVQPRTIDEVYKYWADLGILTGKEHEASEMIRSFQDAVNRFQNLSRSITEKKQVYFEAMHKNMRTISKGSMADFVLKTAGGINIADDAPPSRGTNIAVYSKEKILSKAGKIDVFLTQYGVMNQPTKEMIINEPGFSVIKAVKTGEVYIVDEHIVSRPTLRLLEGIHNISGILYPDLFNHERDQILDRALRPWIEKKDL